MENSNVNVNQYIPNSLDILTFRLKSILAITDRAIQTQDYPPTPLELQGPLDNLCDIVMGVQNLLELCQKDVTNIKTEFEQTLQDIVIKKQ